MMPCRLSLLAFAVLPLLASPTSAASRDLPGWSDTRWGMHPDDISKRHPDLTIAPNQYGRTVGKLDAVTLGGAQFSIELQFDGAPEEKGDSSGVLPKAQWKLARVELHGPKDSCYRIAESLTAKYGPPTKHDPPEYSMGDFYLWAFPTTTIRNVSSSLGGGDCNIIYHPTENSDNL
jgi:hypothetical protein